MWQVNIDFVKNFVRIFSMNFTIKCTKKWTKLVQAIVINGFCGGGSNFKYLTLLRSFDKV